MKLKGYNILLELNFNDCGGKNCLAFFIEDLCIYIEFDYNYFVVCRNFFFKYVNEGDFGMLDGFFYDMFNYVRDDYDLEY